MEIEHKAFKASVQPAAEEGTITALVSCYSVDRAKEKVMPGAFKASLAKKLPKVCLFHDWTKPIGKTLEAYETDRGLVVKAKLNLATTIGKEAHAHLLAGDLDEWSIGYSVVKDSFDKKSGIRNLEQLDLFEVSAVLLGCNPDTSTLEVKNMSAEAAEDYSQQFENRLKALEEEKSRPIRPNFGGNPKGQSAVREVKSLGEAFAESREYNNWLSSKSAESSQFLSDIRLKTLTTTTGWPVENVRSPVMIPYPSRQLRVADLIPHIETAQNAYVYLEETTFTNAAVEVAEGAAKPEANLALTQRTSPVRKIAAWLAATDEQLDDVVGMQDYINSRLSHMVALRLDSQILNGNGTAPNLLGILNVVGIQTQPKATDPTPDAIYKAMNLVRAADAEPSAVIANPADWAEVQLLRTTDGIYIAGSPWTAGPETIWGKPVIVTSAIPAGSILVGDFANFSQIAERQRITVKVGYAGDDFLSNRKSIVGETRVAVVWYRPSAFAVVTGA